MSTPTPGERLGGTATDTPRTASVGFGPAPLDAAALLSLYLWAVGGWFVLSIPLSFVQRELGAVRSRQILLNAVFFLALLGLALRQRVFPALPRARVPPGARSLLLLGSSLSFLACQLCKLQSFTTNGVDFSIFDWMLESTLRGRFMYSPIYDVNHFDIHPSYLMLLLVPLHTLFRTPMLLTVLNGALLWLGVFPAERLARQLTGSAAYGALAAVLYLTNPWTARMLDGGFRPEVAYPLFGLLFAVGWVEARPRRWAAGALGLLCGKEDAGFYLAALALGALFFKRPRRREAIALLAAAVAVTRLDLGLVQPWCLRGHARAQPEYLHFWGQYGNTLGEIVRHMVRAPWRVVADVASSGWLKLFAPALLLPLLSPVPLCAMLPAVVLLGSSSYSMMRSYLTYYPIPLVPFFLWGLFAAYPRLARLPFRDALFTAVRWPSRLSGLATRNTIGRASIC